MRVRFIAFGGLMFWAAALAAQGIAVPAGEREALRLEGKGVQVYRCDGQKWVFVAPEAQLYLHGTQVGTRGAGPAWRHVDGSWVRGEVVSKADSSNPASIPLLLLKAAETRGTGVFPPINFVTRPETKGGIAPEAGCDAAHTASSVRVPYTASYVFYQPVNLLAERLSLGGTLHFPIGGAAL